MKVVEKVPNEPQAKEAAAILEQTYVKARGEQEAKAQSGRRPAQAGPDAGQEVLRRHGAQDRS
jgi:hypothetical protein